MTLVKKKTPKKAPNEGFEFRFSHMHGDADGDSMTFVTIKDEAAADAFAKAAKAVEKGHDRYGLAFEASLAIAEMLEDKSFKFDPFYVYHKERKKILKALKEYRESGEEDALARCGIRDLIMNHMLDWDIQGGGFIAEMCIKEIIWHDGNGVETEVAYKKGRKKK
jgi:hypothetical protein